MIKTIQNLRRKVTPLGQSGRIIVADKALAEFAGKEIEFSITNIKVVS